MGQKQLLVIDSDNSIGETLQRIFQPDYAVTVARDGNDALRIIEQSQHFDAILCDVMMPEMAGTELLDRLVRSSPDQANRVIFITASTWSDASVALFQRRSNPLIAKPFRPTVLKHLVGMVASSA